MIQLFLKMSWNDAIMLSQDLDMYLPNIKEVEKINLPYKFWTNCADSMLEAYNSKKEKIKTNELLNVVLVKRIK